MRNDFDWDRAYIVRLLQYKLEQTRTCIAANNITVGARRVAREIRDVERLLERVVDDRYFDKIAKPFRRKYGRLKMALGEHDPGTNTRTVTFTYPRETPRTPPSRMSRGVGDTPRKRRKASTSRPTTVAETFSRQA